MEPTSTAVLTERIRDAGLKVTVPRLAVMRALEGRPHADADTVFGAVRTDLPGTSLQAVYGVLGALSNAGLLRRIEPPAHPARYERRIGRQPPPRRVQRLWCARGRRLRRRPCPVPHAIQPVPASPIHTAEVTFWGLCPTCQAAPELTSDHTTTKENQ
jgi:Fe2+ or Zn2+ uptake regulation protein